MTDNAEAHRLRRELANTYRDTITKKLNHGSTGNAAVWASNGNFFVTPSGIANPSAGVMVEIGPDGTPLPEQLLPTSELPIYLCINELVAQGRADIGAAVHCHSVYATALAVCNESIPPFHYMVAKAGGTSVDCTPYFEPGSRELARAIERVLGDGRKACLIGNHGQLAVGKDLAKALELAEEVEFLAQTYTEALRIGRLRLLTPGDMSRMLETMKTYGRQ